MEELKKKANARAGQARSSVRMWRAQHEKHNDASSRRLLVTALTHAMGVLDTLDSLGLADESMQRDATAYADESHELQKAGF